MATATEPMRRIADRYDLTALLGRGGAGAVYRAWDTSLERWVAVKVIEADPDGRATARRRTEGRLLASVNHPSLVTLFDAVAAPEVTYLVMELVGGGTLLDRIRSEALDVWDVAGIAANLADGLAHIHARSIVHRDVKPANVLLQPQHGTRAVTAKLSDFGIATLLETSPGLASGVLGTAHYVSPEQARGDTVGPASDVYSLGLTLLEALTGKMSFPGTVAESLTARLLRDPEVPGEFGREWRSLLTAMTSRDPAARPSARDVAERARRLTAAERPEMLATAPLTIPFLSIETAPFATPPLSVSTETSPSATTPIRLVGAARRRSRLLSAAAGAMILAAASVVGLTIGAPSPVAAPAPAAVPPSAPSAAEPATPTAVLAEDSTAASGEDHSGRGASHAEDGSNEHRGKSGR